LIISVVGESGSGKTTLIEKLVPILRSKGLRVAVIKHAKKGFEMDREGKDSHRIYKSGADVALVSENKIAIIKRVDRDDISQVLDFFRDYDLILTEGYGEREFPKIALGSNSERYSNVIAVFGEQGNFRKVEELAEYLVGYIEGKKNIVGSRVGEND
jgi:molybdopterin-guanine dinucleotide biosynthesis protein B